MPHAIISGVGYTEFSANSGVSVLELATTACSRAFADAGLRPADVDGMITYHANDTALTRDVATALHMPLRWWQDVLAGGTYSCASVGLAATLVEAGVARHVVCYRAMNGRSGKRIGRLGAEVRSGVNQFMTPYGFGSPPQVFAMVCRRHMFEYGTTKEQLGSVAIAMREHALGNERATRRSPLTMEDYLNARVIADPYGLFDCCQETDGACAVVVSAPDHASSLDKTPVAVKAFAHGGGAVSRLPFDGVADFATSFFTDLGPQLFERAQLSPADIDVAMLYDAFTFEVIMQLEDLGFCKRGEAGAFVADGQIGPGGSLPVNTHGGLLSEGYIHGLNHVVEAVEQLRGESGDRQVSGAQHALVTGFGFNAGSALVLGTA
jgi:acetyl-CoA acetyltransferase